MIGEIEATLSARGLAQNTYIVFSSDNGLHMGEHRLMPGKQTAFDTDIRVPLIVVGPNVPAGRSMGELTENIDLCPTFERLAGAPVGANVDGRSLDGAPARAAGAGCGVGRSWSSTTARCSTRATPICPRAGRATPRAMRRCARRRACMWST